MRIGEKAGFGETVYEVMHYQTQRSHQHVLEAGNADPQQSNRSKGESEHPGGSCRGTSDGIRPACRPRSYDTERTGRSDDLRRKCAAGLSNV